MWTRFVDMLCAPWRAWTKYQLAKMRVHAEISAKPLEIMLNIVREQADVQREQTRVLQTWLDGFRVHETPTSTVIRDEDEVAAEREREGISNMEVLRALDAEAAKVLEDLVSFDMPEK